MIPTEAATAVTLPLKGKNEPRCGEDGKANGSHVATKTAVVVSPSKGVSWPSRRSRLPSSSWRFRNIKRSRLTPSQFPTRRMHLVYTPMHRTNVGDSRFRPFLWETKSAVNLTKITKSRNDSRSSLRIQNFDDAVVPRCYDPPPVADDVVALASKGPIESVRSHQNITRDNSRRRHHRHQHHHQQQQPRTVADLVPNDRLINIPVPDDPRHWSRLDVRTWLEHMRHICEIQDLDLNRFPMNGKALCIMTKDMFIYRVPDGGIPLYLDFQARFRRALELR